VSDTSEKVFLILNFKSLFKNSKVLITGHTGFKGSWLTAWLQSLGAKVVGVAFELPSQPSHYEDADLSKSMEDHRVDIRNGYELKRLVSGTQPDFVFHLAAQSLVRQSYLDPVETYQTNVLGTLNLLEGLRLLKKPCTAVLITSDKCYDNVEWVWGYRETDSLGGPDPYSASKGAAELVIRSHVKSFFPSDGVVRVAVGRAGNVIGGGDWASDRIVPDCVRSWAKGETVQLRNPQATRPWQHVLEPLSGYLTLAAELYKNSELHGEPFNFGPPAHQTHTVLELVQSMSRHWDQVRWEDLSASGKHPYESGLLKLNCDKALHHLHWQAILPFKETVRMTSEWYRSYYENPSTIREVTLTQIREYETLIAAKCGKNN
jgi:CDP-glucose 4,6-dehydratase